MSPEKSGLKHGPEHGPEHDPEQHGAEPSFTMRNLGAIKAASAIMGVLIIVLTAVLVATVISRLSDKAAPPEAAALTLPAGAELRAASAADNGYVLVVDTPSGQEIWRVSPSGERLQVISVTQE